MKSISNPPDIQYDFFIAYPSAAVEQANAIHDLLADSSQVYLDSINLKAGQNWATAIQEAQAASRMTVALICHEYQAAYYAQEEVAAGIAYERVWGKALHCIVPVFLNGIPLDPAQIPYGLRCKHALDMLKLGGLKSVAGKLKDMLGPSIVNSAPGSTPKRTAVAFEHPLKQYPTGPLVPSELVCAELVQSYAQLIRQFEAQQVIADANRFRLEADPEDPAATTIKEFQLLPVYSVPPYAFWLSAFVEARLHGPRMLAALLMVVPDDQFGVKARSNRHALLDSLLKS